MSQSDACFRVIYLPGMQGEMPGDRWLVRGLVEAGLTDSRIFNWPRSAWPLTNLRNREGHTAAAHELVHQIRQTHDPDAPSDDVNEPTRRRVALIGHSTGAMVILDALAMLDAGEVEQAWLLAAAVGAGYDIRPALSKVDRLANVYSPVDWAVLSAGTMLFGTADGQCTAAAGYRGFTGPGHDDPRLTQMRYDPAWLKSGHYGGHLGPLGIPFARQVLGPAIVDFTPTADA
jgi:hypothetical protein